eukprot:1231955-Amorphochlora_amoeboformis.AAC.1
MVEKRARREQTALTSRSLPRSKVQRPMTRNPPFYTTLLNVAWRRYGLAVTFLKGRVGGVGARDPDFRDIENDFPYLKETANAPEL